jgi:hypothetical protein
LYLEIDRFKKEKKEAFSLIKARDVELGRQNRKVLDLNKRVVDMEQH